MNEQINLLSHKKKKLFTRDSFLQIVQFLARILLIATVLTAVTLFILNRSGKLPLLQQQDKTISSNLSFLQQRIIKFLLIRERLSNIDPLLNKKSSIDEIIANISTSLPDTISVDTFTLSEHTITLIVSSSSLTDMNTFLDEIVTTTSQKNLFKKVTVVGLSTDTNGKYDLSLTMLY